LRSFFPHEKGEASHVAVSEAPQARSELAESRASSGRGIPGRSEGDKGSMYCPTR